MDIPNYADGNTPCATANDTDSLIASLEKVSKSLFTWFDNNLMKGNSEKCHLLVSSNEKVTNKIGSYEVANILRSLIAWGRGGGIVGLVGKISKTNSRGGWNSRGKH